MFKTDNNS